MRKQRLIQESNKAFNQGLYKLALIAFVLLTLALLSLTGCAKHTTVVENPPAVAPTVTTAPATAAECPAGGLEVYVNNVESVVCNGENGQAGLDGTQITVVQFCSGTAVYPSSFPEVGLDIGGKIYGVYSANGGFLAYLPPGEYQSTGIGSGLQCDFTINADGTITR